METCVESKGWVTKNFRFLLSDTETSIELNFAVLRLNVIVNSRSFFGDVEIIFKTLGALLPQFVLTGLLWICVIAVALLSVLPGEDIPGAFVFWDKAQHFLAFLVLALLGCWAYPGRALHLFLGMLVFGAGIEIGQSFLPWRNGDAFDFVADAIGVLIVVVLRTHISPANKLFWQRR